jgi:hypothetical protein
VYSISFELRLNPNHFAIKIARIANQIANRNISDLTVSFAILRIRNAEMNNNKTHERSWHVNNAAHWKMLVCHFTPPPLDEDTVPTPAEDDGGGATPPLLNIKLVAHVLADVTTLLIRALIASL